MGRVRPTIGRRPNPQRQSVSRRPANDEGPRFIMGLDLGQAQDYSALAIIERWHGGRGPRRRDVPQGGSPSSSDLDYGRSQHHA
jgi:hypothetical protein